MTQLRNHGGGIIIQGELAVQDGAQFSLTQATTPLFASAAPGVQQHNTRDAASGKLIAASRNGSPRLP